MDASKIGAPGTEVEMTQEHLDALTQGLDMTDDSLWAGMTTTIDDYVTVFEQMELT